MNSTNLIQVRYDHDLQSTVMRIRSIHFAVVAGLTVGLILSACSPFHGVAPVPSPVSTVAGFQQPVTTHGTGAMLPVPPRTGLMPGSLRLPGATLNNRGGVRAVVFPVSVGERFPAWSDTLIARRLFGAAPSIAISRGYGTAGQLAEASRGLFRIDASIFPYVIDVTLTPDDLPRTLSDPTALASLAENVIRDWTSRANLTAFDNDGADGQPMSGDDDGRIDFPVIVIETDSTPALVRVPLDLSISAGQDRRFRIYVADVHVIAIPRSGEWSDDNLGMLSLILSAMGLGSDEMFFPDGYGRAISTLARVRLGWLATHWAGRSGVHEVVDGRAVVVPIVDVDDARGMWLIERSGDLAYLTRVSRKQDGHFATVDTRLFRVTDEAMIIPLTRSEGSEGPHAKVRWTPEGILEARVALSSSAIRTGIADTIDRP